MKEEIEAAWKKLYEVSDQPLSYHIWVHLKQVMGNAILPQDDQTFEHLLTEKIHPLMLIQMLCQVGHLEKRESEFLKGSF